MRVCEKWTGVGVVLASNRGRKTSYRKEFADQAYKYCLLGATDVQLAEFFEVSEQTINAWKDKHPEFLESIKNGKEKADAEVADRLYQRAKGYSHPEEKIFLHNGEPVKVETVKHYAPDPTSGIFWLKNRQKLNWRDKRDHTLSGDEENPVNINLGDLMNQALREKARIEGEES